MNRARFGWTLCFVAFATVIGVYVRHLFVRTPVARIMFARKAYFDAARSGRDEYVYVAGTLTGDGVGYENNTTAITCFRDRMECLTYSIQQIGANQVSRLDSPVMYPVIKWDAHEIVASGSADAFACRKLTISIARTSQTVVWVEEPINQGAAACKDSEMRVLKWTIEDPPGWKALESKAID